MELLAGLPVGDYGAVVARFHAAYAEAKGKPCWANVDIATLDHMDLVNSWFPQARFLHIIRDGRDVALSHRSEEHTSELQSLMRISYAVFCLKKKKQNSNRIHNIKIKYR